ncbi:Arl3p interacting protein [Cichlidogyrus casuarinus]|uniref:Arl3p interacting protein n=1 Tax=Cichlidogyrus casuarinus TaxID=1844966 RepID=A0ABD2PVR9_9PLAT
MVSLQIAAQKSSAASLNDQPECKFDSTGMFHWCTERSLERCLLDRQQTSLLVFSDHIVICLFADPISPLIGLRSFVMPLRASNIHYHDLKHIIFLGNLDYIRREWKSLAHFPKISAFPGSPLNRANLRSVNINLASMCVVLSSKGMAGSLEDSTLSDKEAILCSLNIKAMQFDENQLEADESLSVDDYNEGEFGNPGRKLISPATALSTELLYTVQSAGTWKHTRFHFRFQHIFRTLVPSHFQRIKRSSY